MLGDMKLIENGGEDIDELNLIGKLSGLILWKMKKKRYAEHVLGIQFSMPQRVVLKESVAMQREEKEQAVVERELVEKLWKLVVISFEFLIVQGDDLLLALLERCLGRLLAVDLIELTLFSTFFLENNM